MKDFIRVGFIKIKQGQVIVFIGGDPVRGSKVAVGENNFRAGLVGNNVEVG